MTNAVLAGDVGALYSFHAPWLRSWLRRRLRCPDRAADITQDTFCRLIERGPSERLHDPRRYLATVARRLLIDDVRKAVVERSFLDAWADMQPSADPLTPERIAEAVQVLGGILQILSGLSQEIQTAFLLRRIDGFSHGEIAGRLGLSDRTVKRHIARAYAACYFYAYPD